MVVSCFGLISVFNSPSCRLTVDGLSCIPVFPSWQVWGEMKGQRCSCREQRCFVSSLVSCRSGERWLRLRPRRTGKMGLYCRPAWEKSEFPGTTRKTGMTIVLTSLTPCVLLVGLLVSSDRKIPRIFAAFWENAHLLWELWRVQHTDTLTDLCVLSLNSFELLSIAILIPLQYSDSLTRDAVYKSRSVTIHSLSRGAGKRCRGSILCYC